PGVLITGATVIVSGLRRFADGKLPCPPHLHLTVCRRPRPDVENRLRRPRHRELEREVRMFTSARSMYERAPLRAQHGPADPPSRLVPLKWLTIIPIVVTFGFLGVFHHLLQNWRGTVVLAVATLAELLIPSPYRSTRSLLSATHYIAAIAFGTIVSLVTFTGGLYSPAIAWLVTAPM